MSIFHAIFKVAPKQESLDLKKELDDKKQHIVSLEKELLNLKNAYLDLTIDVRGLICVAAMSKEDEEETIAEELDGIGHTLPYILTEQPFRERLIEPDPNPTYRNKLAERNKFLKNLEEKYSYSLNLESEPTFTVRCLVHMATQLLHKNPESFFKKPYS